MKKIILLLCSCYLFSCTDKTEFSNISINFEDLHDPTPVVLSFFSPDSKLQITVNNTLPAFDKNEATNSPNINNATIENQKSGVIKELIPDSTFENRFFSEICINEGAICKVNFEISDIENQWISATDTVPFSSKIESVIVIPDAKRSESTRLSLVKLKISPSLFQTISYYEVSVMTTITDSIGYRGYPLDSIDLVPYFRRLSSDDPLITNEDYYPSIMQFNAIPPEILYFKKPHNLENLYVEFYYEPPSIASRSIIQTFGHTATIYLKTISKNYYRYQLSKLNQIYSREGDPLYGAGDPVKIFSNIHNGTGIFAAYTTDSIVFTSEKGYIDEL